MTHVSLRICGTLSSSKSTPAVMTSSIAGVIKNGTTVLGSESLKLSRAAQQRVAVAHGEI